MRHIFFVVSTLIQNFSKKIKKIKSNNENNNFINSIGLLNFGFLFYSRAWIKDSNIVADYENSTFICIFILFLIPVFILYLFFI